MAFGVQSITPSSTKRNLEVLFIAGVVSQYVRARAVPDECAGRFAWTLTERWLLLLRSMELALADERPIRVGDVT